MGRWAQRSRSGGGTAILNYMLRASATDTTHARITFAENVSAAAFDVGGFESSPSGATAQVFVQVSKRIVDLEWDGSTAADDEVVYVQNAPGFQPNQHLQYE